MFIYKSSAHSGKRLIVRLIGNPVSGPLGPRAGPGVGATMPLTRSPISSDRQGTLVNAREPTQSGIDKKNRTKSSTVVYNERMMSSGVAYTKDCETSCAAQ